jgi:uncharacterized protein YyaL (SSP411 family)
MLYEGTSFEKIGPGQTFIEESSSMLITTLLRSRSLILLLTVLSVSIGQRNLVTLADESKKPESEADATNSKDESSAVKHPANRLAKESSPYLLMHAHNPVDWYPWGPEAFEKAKEEEKLIFLSVGYSSCYWCHVMERKTFSSEQVAEFLNKHFVCIKVDREERPDIDDIYMTSLIVYLQAAGSRGGGGWPLSMFLTPDGQPIAGATYLPPEDTAEGGTGFLTAAGRIQDLWSNQRDSIHNTATMIAREVRRLSGPSVLAEQSELKREQLKLVADDIGKRYDSVHGGVDFNERKPDGPRFPNVPRLLFLLSLYEENKDPALLQMVDHTLTEMAKGGIRDHLGGGFHRYSTDRRWNVPHFEKMLYDQAQMLEVYAHAARVSKNPLYDQVIDELVGFLTREMTLPDGGFCSALDAETNAIEGEYYAWTEQQVRDSLKAEEAELFLEAYGFKQPQSFEHGRVLFLPTPLAELAAARSLDVSMAEQQLAAMRAQLLKVRSERPRPMLDDKVLTEWNALMIQGLAVSGRLPGREKDLKIAGTAADFLLTKLRDSEGNLLRSWRNNTPGQRGFLDDYACLVSALRALHDSTGEVRWLTAASELMNQQIAQFYDETQKTFFFTANDQEQLFARTSTPYDSVTPSGNSMTIRNLLALSQQAENESFRLLAETTLQRFSGMLESSPSACSGLALALQDLLKLQAMESGKAVSATHGDAKSLTSKDRWPYVRQLVRQDMQLCSLGDENPVVEDKSDNSPAAVEEQQSFKPVLPDPAKPSPFKRNYDERPIKAKIYPYFDKLQRGGKCPVAIELTIANDWHINANPAHPDFMIPTEIRITSAQKVKMTKLKYPEHELLEVEGQDEPSHVYGGKVVIYALLETDAAEMAEKADVEVEIKFQACNSRTCEPPDSIKLKGKLTLADPGDEIKRINETKFPKEDEKGDEEKQE